MQLDRTPFFDRLADARRILIAGAGGGFDVFSGLPLYFRLKDRGHEVHLANLSFAHTGDAQGRRPADAVVEVDADSLGWDDYFPEKHLCAWFRSRGDEVSIWCFSRRGGRELTQAYRAVVEELQVDAVVLVDGGTDSLMRGDEAVLGTPLEDVVSLAAVDGLDVPTKLLACVGFGIDEICHAHYLEAVAHCIKEGGFLGAQSWLAEMPEVRLYREAVAAVCAATPKLPSIICTSIVAALDGEYGDHHPTERTKGSTLWINPLMSLMWTFELDAVARRCLYLDAVKETADFVEIHSVIHESRQARGRVRPWMNIPV
jgi:hypothetical protein